MRSDRSRKKRLVVSVTSGNAGEDEWKDCEEQASGSCPVDPESIAVGHQDSEAGTVDGLLCSGNDDGPDDASYSRAEECEEREKSAEEVCDSVSEEAHDEGEASEDGTNDEKVEGSLRETTQVGIAGEDTAWKSICDLSLGILRYIEQDSWDRSELVCPARAVTVIGDAAV